MADSSFRGRFLWHELLTSDTAAAAKFFGRVIGWKTETWPLTPGYTLFKMGRQMAGLMSFKDASIPEGIPPHWMSYIGTPNVDETVKQAVSLGGKVMKAPADIPTIGRFAVLSDPQGAAFIAFTPIPQAGMDPSAKPGLGDFSWHELATTDWKAAFTFYKACFGWEETSAMDMGPGLGMYQMFGIGGVAMGGIFNKPAQMPGPPNWLPYIMVGEARKTVDVVKAAGGQIINGPMEVPGGDWIAQGLDPQGGVFAVHSLNPATAAAAPVPARPAASARKAAPKKAASKKPVAKKKPAPKKKPVAKKKAVPKKAKKKAAPKKKTKPAKKRKAGAKK